jgi:hypothetical protein
MIMGLGYNEEQMVIIPVLLGFCLFVCLVGWFGFLSECLGGY